MDLGYFVNGDKDKVGLKGKLFCMNHLLDFVFYIHDKKVCP